MQCTSHYYLAFKQRSVYIFAFYFHKILPLHTILVNLLSSSPLCHFFVPPASTTRLTFYRITCCVIFCDIHIRGDCLFVCFFIEQPHNTGTIARTANNILFSAIIKLNLDIPLVYVRIFSTSPPCLYGNICTLGGVLLF